jgi:glyoxylase I family protein
MVIPIRTTAILARHRAGSISPMTIPTTTTVAHIRLTVTDIVRSRQFYESVFGWPINLEMPEDADAATRERLGFLFGGVLYNVGDARVGLRPGGTDRFDEDRTGLDHLAFRLGNRFELDYAAKHLDDLGIAHEPIKDIGVTYILEFRDPDNIALELTAPK